jgi:hypothetical protein
LVQVPWAPASPHDWHVPAQAVAQQNPCWHSPVRHSVPDEQAVPVGFFVQAPRTQTLGAVQSVSTVQEVRQTMAAQA